MPASHPRSASLHQHRLAVASWARAMSMLPAVTMSSGSAAASANESDAGLRIRFANRNGDFFCATTIAILAEDSRARAQRIVSAQTGGTEAARKSGRHDDLVAALPARAFAYFLDDARDLAAGMIGR